MQAKKICIRRLGQMCEETDKNYLCLDVSLAYATLWVGHDVVVDVTGLEVKKDE